MKIIALIICLLVATGCAGPNFVEKKFEPGHIIPLSEFQKLNGVTELNNFASYLNKGDSFPLELDLDNDVIGISQKNIDLVVKEKLYFMIKVPENLSKEELAELETLNAKTVAAMSESDREKFFQRFMLYVSRDAVNWAPFNEIKAMRQVFAAKRGAFSFGLGMNQKEGIKSVFSVKTFN